MITTVTLNTSIDKAYFMEKEIVNGTVMRVSSCKNSAGGKGLNVARTVRRCGEKVKAIGFAGGYNGKYLEQLLAEDGIPYEFVQVSGETRSCINILDPKYHSTEYLEPGFILTEKDEQKLVNRFPEMIKDSDVVTISGSIPKGMSTDIYFRLIQTAKKLGKKVLLDTSGEPLKYGVEALPTLVKPNRQELDVLFQVKIQNVQDAVSCGMRLHDKGIAYVVISLGSDGAVLICDEGVFLSSPPRVNAVNTVGCGDSMIGAFAVALERSMSAENALEFAVAVAAAKAESTETGDFDYSRCECLLDKVIIERMQ